MISYLCPQVESQGVAAAKFAMECQLLPTEQDLFTSVLYTTVYIKEEWSPVQWLSVYLMKKNREFAEIACNWGKCSKLN